MTITKDLTPFKVVMKSKPQFPYLGIVWARSKTQACNEFVTFLTQKGYSRIRTSPSAYDTEEMKPQKALALKWSIMLNKPEAEEIPTNGKR